MQGYAEALWREPNDAFVQERLMQLYIASSQMELWGKAYRIAENILQHDPKSLAAINCIAQYAEGIQDPKTAAHFYRRIGEVAREQNAHIESALAFGKAAELLERVDIHQAYELWQLAAIENTNYRPAITALTRYALKTGDFERAREILHQLITQTPPGMECARYHLSLAGLYRSRLRNLENARQQLDLAAPYLSEDLPYLRELAEFRLATDENVDALRILDRLINRAQTLKQPVLSADLLFRSGQILAERLGHSEQALYRYREVLKIRPNHVSAADGVRELEIAGVVEEHTPIGYFESPELLIAEKERALERYTHLPTEIIRLQLELCRLYWQNQDPDLSIKAGHNVLLYQPANELAWKLLEEICVRSGRNAELAMMHRDMASQSSTEQEALRHLEEALRLLPTDRTTIGYLSQYYEKYQQFDKLDVLYSRWLDISTPEETPQLLLLQAKLREHHLQHIEQAELVYVQAFQAATEREPYLIALIQFYIRHNLWDKLDLQISHLARGLTPKVQAEIYAEKGLQLSLLADKALHALNAYQRALLHDANNPKYILPTIALLRQQDQYAELVPLLEQMADQTTETAQELSYRIELARLLDYQLDQSELALKQYQRIVELQHEDLDILKRLAVLYKQYINDDQITEIYARILGHLEADDNSVETVALLQQMILEFEYREQPELQNRTVAKLLQCSPHFGEQNAEIKLLEGDNSSTASKVRVFFAIGQSHNQPGLLLKAALGIANDSPDVASACVNAGLEIEPLHPQLWLYRIKQTPATQRVELWRELLDILSRMGRSLAAMEQLGEIFSQIQKTNISLTLEEIAPIYHQLKEWGLSIGALSQLYAYLLELGGQIDRALHIRRELLAQLPTGSEQRDLRFELAIQQIRLFGEIESGEQQLWSLLLDDPSHNEAFYELQQLYEENGHLEIFVQKLEQTAAQTQAGPQRADLYLRSFEFFRAIYDQPEEIIAFLERARQNASDDPHTLHLIAVAYEEAGSIEDSAILYRQVGLLAGDMSIAEQSLERAAEIYSKDLEQPDVAIDIWKELLSINPKHERAFAQLAEIYETLWMWAELAQLFEEYIEYIEFKDQATEYLIKLGDIYLGRLNDYETALNTYRRALRKAPRNIQVLRALQALYEEIEDWPAVVGALKAIARIEVDREQLFAIHIAIATYSLDYLEQIAETEQHYKLAHTQQPNRMEPIEGLIALYEAIEKYDQAAHNATLLAVLCIRQQKTALCRTALQKVIESLQRSDSEHSPQALLRSVLNERQESAALAQSLFDILRELTDVPLNEEQKYELHKLTSKLYQQQLQELAWLLRLWHSGEEEAISDSTLRKILQTIRESAWPETIALLQQLQKNARDDEAFSYSLAIAEIYFYALKQYAAGTEQAKQALQKGSPPERALTIFRQHQQLKSSTIRLGDLLSIAQQFTPSEELSRALFHLAHIFIAEQQWSDALYCLSAASAHTPHGDLLKPTVAMLHEFEQNPITSDNDELNQPSINTLQPAYRPLMQAWLCFKQHKEHQGYELLAECLNLDPDCSPAMRLVGQYLLEHQQTQEALPPLFRFLEREWEYLPFDEVVDLCLSLAQIYDSQQNLDNALFYLGQAVKFVPEDPRVLSLHTQILQRAELWNDLKYLYESHIENPEPTDDIAELWFCLGQLHQEQLDDIKTARACYQKAIQCNPEHQNSIQAYQHLSQQLEL
jgi:tetratricopeptide (TPR) repeat protein